MIEEANWLTLPEDIQKPGDGYDSVICLGNSFAHLPDFKGLNRTSPSGSGSVLVDQAGFLKIFLTFDLLVMSGRPFNYLSFSEFLITF